MHYFICFLAAFFISVSALSGDVPKIEPGEDYGKYSEAELRERVYQLEKAVRALQERESLAKNQKSELPANPKKWNCVLTKGNNTYKAYGPKKSDAIFAVRDKCSDGEGGNAFHCFNPTCTVTEK